jgi:hypothetical protein
MASARTLGNTAWRDFVEDGVPSSGPNHPSKAEIRAFVDALVRGELKSDDFKAQAGGRYNVDTSSGTMLATLPDEDDLSAGDEFYFNDYAGTWGTNNFTIFGGEMLFDDGIGGTIDNLVCNSSRRILVVYSGDGILKVF